MQWRLLRRRCPIRSMTVVGDMAQSSSATGARTWNRALAPLLGRNRDQVPVRVEQLTVNYRTPAQIAQAAEAVALSGGLDITPSLSVREGDWPVEAFESADFVSGAVEAVALIQDAGPGGSIAVIVEDHVLARVTRRLAEVYAGQVGTGDRDIHRPITVLSPREAKGLEFDSVVIVDPDGIRAASARGLSALYVSLTRPTQRLIAVVSPGSALASLLLTSTPVLDLDGHHD